MENKTTINKGRISVGIFLILVAIGYFFGVYEFSELVMYFVGIGRKFEVIEKEVINPGKTSAFGIALKALWFLTIPAICAAFGGFVLIISSNETSNAESSSTTPG
jgi:TM2 domain-containing membrane protein YozV